MKVQTIFSLLSLCTIFLQGCTKVNKYNPDIIIIPIGENINSNIGKAKSPQIHTYSIIPLETNDSLLLHNFIIREETDSSIILTDNNNVYFFYKNGELNYKINKTGNGQGEYLFINDFTINKQSNIIYIHDLQKRTILTYNIKGKYIKSFKNDSIAAIKWTTDNEIIATYSPSEPWRYSIGKYDTLFNTKKAFLKRQITTKKANLFLINNINNFNDQYFTYTNDTLYRVDPNQVSPFLAIGKGKLKLPNELSHQISNDKRRDQYIWGEYGLLIGNFYFISYNYKGNSYYDVWDIRKQELKCRNIISYNDETEGIPFIIKEQNYYLWPKAVIGNSLFFIIKGTDMSRLIPTRNEEENSILIKASIEDLMF